MYVETLESNDELKNKTIENETIGCFSSKRFYKESCVQMERKIIKLAFNILEKRKQEKFEELEKEHLIHRIQCIEISLNNITQKLDKIMTK